MRILIINPPYQTITCSLGVGHHVPLGLLMVGGPLVDAGHEVELLDAEVLRMKDAAIVRHVRKRRPDIVMVGHAGSTPAHPIAMRLLRQVREAYPEALTVYGGIYPTFHAEEVLAEEPAVDIIVRGEGEVTALELVEALDRGTSLGEVQGIAYRQEREIRTTPERSVIEDFGPYRVGWELVDDWSRYQTLDLGTSGVVQFARGCPHGCTYCGQRKFWRRWRSRGAKQVADEVEHIHREYGVRFIHLADDNPTSDRGAWVEFLEEMASRELPVNFHATIRAGDIVRDADILPLYRKAGILYILLGMESVYPHVLDAVHKGSDVDDDAMACELLRENGIFSVVGQVVGLAEDTWGTFRETLRRLIAYDSDWVNVMYVVPHAWTEFAQTVAPEDIIEHDLTRWDYRHPVLRPQSMRPWQLVLAAKWLELRFHARPGKLWRALRAKDRFYRKEFWCAFRHTTPVWFAELACALWDMVGRR